MTFAAPRVTELHSSPAASLYSPGAVVASVRIAVLGSGGSIGNAVARRATLGGHQVRAVVRDPSRRLGLPPTVEVYGADLLDANAVVKACDEADAVVHAANVPYPEWARLAPRQAENALRAAEAAGAVLTLPGNVYVYGRPRNRPVTEDHPMEPHTIKGKIRLGIERSYLQAHREGRVRVVIPRYPDFYGPNVLNDLIRPIFEGALSGKPCGWPVNADIPHEFVLIDDAAAAMLTLIQTPASYGRAVHVPGPGEITAREFIRLAYEAAGHDAKVRVYGRSLMRLVALTNRDVRSALEMMYLFEDSLILDGRLYKSLTGSGAPATTYQEGVRRTLEWFRTHRRAVE